MSHEVTVCSACDWAGFPIPALEFDSEEVMQMMHNSFGPRLVDFASEAQLKRAVDISCLELKLELGKVIMDFTPGILFIHNPLFLPIHMVLNTTFTMPATSCLTRTLPGSSGLLDSLPLRYHISLSCREGVTPSRRPTLKLCSGNWASQAVFLGHVPADHLPYLYHGTTVFATVSLSEGFRLPCLARLRPQGKRSSCSNV